MKKNIFGLVCSLAISLTSCGGVSSSSSLDSGLRNQTFSCHGELYAYPLYSSTRSTKNFTIGEDMTVEKDPKLPFSGIALEAFSLSESNFDAYISDPVAYGSSTYSGFASGTSSASIRESTTESYVVKGEDDASWYFLLQKDGSLALAWLSAKAIRFVISYDPVEKGGVSDFLSLKLSSSFGGSYSDFSLAEGMHIKIERFVDYYLYCYLPPESFVKDSDNGVAVGFSGEAISVSYSYSSSYSGSVAFVVSPKTLLETGTIGVTYHGIEVSFIYSVVDFSFADHHASAPSSLDDLKKFSEFTEMLTSLSFHEFESPYKGIKDYSYNDTSGVGFWDYDFPQDEDTKTYSYDLGYLPFVTDSCYYPTKFPMVNENPISMRRATLRFFGKDAVKEGAAASKFSSLEVYFSVVDPYCTDPKSPCQNLSFSSASLDDEGNVAGTSFDSYSSTYYYLSKEHPSSFFHYQILGLDISIIVINGQKAFGFFDSGSYHYTLASNYVFA